MATTPIYDSEESGSLLRQLGRVALSLLLAAAVLYGLATSFSFIKDRNAPEQFLLRLYQALGLERSAALLQQDGLNPFTSKLLIALVALVVGVAGVWLLFWVSNDLIGRLPSFVPREKLRPIIFVGPAVLLLSVFLLYPAANTAFLSLTEDIMNVPDEVPEELRTQENIAQALVEDARNVTFGGYLLNVPAVEIARVSMESGNALLVVRGDRVTAYGLQNYRFAFTNPNMHIAFRNNILWLVVGTTVSVGLGLVIAALVDRIRSEALAKSFIFMPLAISFVGASVIWKFVYAWQPAGRPQIGILNAVVTSLGLEPIPWLLDTPLNTFALIAIMIWLQTGFAMVVLSAALKGVPNELLEAARIDGASEIQIFFRVLVPYIWSAILTVATTIFISILKVFDIVYVMTSGNFETEVIANRMFVEMFNFRNFGRASALAVILLLVVVPIMIVNIRNLRRQGMNQ